MTMHIHFLRHATLVLTLGENRILIDPMLSARGAMDPVANAADTRRIPLVDLPLEEAALRDQLASLTAVVVTHTHRDHWDIAAQTLLSKDLPVYTQPEDVAAIRAQGFNHVNAIADTLVLNDIQITRTGGRHGTGEIGARMGPVSGFVFAHQHHKIYIAGDTIWCPEVAEALRIHQPDVIVLNAGAAQFNQGDPITMTADDVVRVCRTMPASRVIAVHLDTINHCLLTREALRVRLQQEGLQQQCILPADGDAWTLF